MNKKITKEQIEDCIYLFQNVCVRRPVHSRHLANMYSAQLNCDNSLDSIVNTIAADNVAFNHLVKVLKQAIAQADVQVEFELLALQNKKRP